MNNIEYLYALLTSKWDEPRIGKESLELAFPVWYTYNHIYNICRCTSSINFILWSLYIPNMFFLTFPTFPHPVGRPNLGRPNQGRLRRFQGFQGAVWGQGTARQYHISSSLGDRVCSSGIQRQVARELLVDIWIY